MGVIRVEKNSNYTVMSNYHFKEKAMSLKAKGLLSLMLSLPDEWDYSVAGLVAICKEGKDGINATLKELEKFGYVKREQNKDKRGRFADIDYIIYEKPNPELIQSSTEKPITENPSTVKPISENPQQLNTNILNTNNNKLLNNKDKIDIDTSYLKEKNNLSEVTNNNEQVINIEDLLPETRLFITSKFISEEEAAEVNKIIQEAKSQNTDHNIYRICQYIIDNALDPERIINKKSYLETSLLHNISKLNALVKLKEQKTYSPERSVPFYNWLQH